MHRLNWSVESLVVLLVVAIANTTAAIAAVPAAITVQGRLTDASGNPISGPQNFTFKIFDASVGGTIVWPGGGGENQSLNSDAGGLWIGMVGAVSPLTDSVFADTSRWLEITVAGTTLPRVRLVTGPFAYRTSTVDGAAGGTITAPLTIGASNSIGIGSLAVGAMNSVGNNSLVAGSSNTTIGWNCSIAGGQSNYAGDLSCAIGGGQEDTVTGQWCYVGGGRRNVVAGEAAFIGGGFANRSTGPHNTIAGGYQNVARLLAEKSTIGGGGFNLALGGFATIGGGLYDTASGAYSTVGGGNANHALSVGSTVSGGTENFAQGARATVVGGAFNLAKGLWSVAGGHGSRAIGWNSVAFGGGSDVADSNVASGDGSVVPGGIRNRAAGNVSFAAGNRARAMHHGSFVWSDNAGTDFSSTANNQFLVRASGGVGIGTNNPQAPLQLGDVGTLSLGLMRMETRGTTGAYRSWDVGVAGGGADVTGKNYSFSIDDRALGTNPELIVKWGTGNVGIGEPNPTYKLQVVEPGNAGLRVQTNSAGGAVASFGGNGEFQIDAVNLVGGRLTIK